MAVIQLADFRGTELVSELFVAPRSLLRAAFPGWLPPLEHTVRRHLYNPFTKEAIFRESGEPWMIDTREPEGPWPADVRCPNLEAFTRLSIRPVRESDLVELGRVLPTPVTTTFAPALFAPPSHGWFLSEVPQSLCAALASLDLNRPVAAAWLAALRSANDFDPDDYAPIDDWAKVVREIVAIAERAVSENQSVLLYDGPRPHR